MANRDDLVEEVLLSLAGYLTDQELIGSLAGTLTTSTSTFTVTGSVFPDGSGFQPGLAEIGNELVYVGSVNPATGEFSNVIRGFRGTAAVAWTAGTVVRANPRVPRSKVIRAINDTIDEVYPRLWAVAEDQFPAYDFVTSYDLPTDALDVISVAMQEPDVVSAYRQSQRWQFVANASTESVTGKQIHVGDAWAGADIHVVYAKAPVKFSEVSGTNEDFTTATGLEDWCREVVTLGAAYKVMAFLDAGRIAERTAEGDLLALQSPIGTAQKLSQHLFALYQERLGRAEARLRSQYDVGSIHYKMW